MKNVAVLAALLVAAACGDSPSDVEIAATWSLSTVDGKFLPAAVDSFEVNDGAMRLYRIVGRTIDIISSDSARYLLENDVVAVLRWIDRPAIDGFVQRLLAALGR